MDDWIDKRWYRHRAGPYGGIKKDKQSSDICYNMNEPNTHTRGKKPTSKGQTLRVHGSKSPSRKCEQVESRPEVAADGLQQGTAGFFPG